MPYPFWDVGLGYGILMAVIAVVHVFVSHFAIGGGLYLVWAERSARKSGDENRLDFVRRLSKFFVLVTVVFGALTGVMIWFIIGLLNPKATEALIHNFVWGWAIEWTFFVIEILAAILYFYGWKRMSAKGHMTLGWIYFAAAWLSLVVINGIVTFMLTPGSWIESGAFWEGFFNPTYFSSLALRTAICILLAGLFALFVASGYPLSKLKRKLVRYNAVWAIAGLLLAGACFFWYRKDIGETVYQIASQALTIPATSLNLLQIVSYALLAALAVVGLAFPKALVQPVGVLLLAGGLVWFGSYEWFRESARKPYVVYGYMYANAMRVDHQAEFRKTGLLERVDFRTDDAGADLWRYSCRHCHTLDGYNPVQPAIDHTDAAYLAGLVQYVDRMRWRMPPGSGNEQAEKRRWTMPPWFGNEKEAKLLGDWLWSHANQRPLASATEAEGPELGERVFDLRCGRCHMWDVDKKWTEAIATYEPEDLSDLLQDEDGIPDMPIMVGMPDAERKALIEFLTPRLMKGGE